MNLVNFLQNLSFKGVQISPKEDGQLRIGGSKKVLNSTIIESLKQQKSEILELLRDRPDILDVHPLSYGQKGLWFLWQLTPDSAAYHMAFACRIYSPLQIESLQQACQILCDRHANLRSTFPQLESGPVQWVHQTQQADFQWIDASSWQESEVRDRATLHYKTPFNLERDSAMRVRVFTQNEQQHILLVTIHHIAGDGWSIELVVNELLSLYAAISTGKTPALPPLEPTFQDYVRWQQNLLESPTGKKLRDYWQQQLSGQIPVLQFPADYPRSALQTYNGATQFCQLPNSLIEKLRNLAVAERTTLYVLLLTTFQVLLYRYTGQEDILVGSPLAAGRSQSQFTAVVGNFIDQVVLRGKLTGNLSFRELVAQTRRTVLDAFTNQGYPFPLLVEELEVQRNPSYNPIFQTAFILQNFRQSPVMQALFSPKASQEPIAWYNLQLAAFEMPQQEGQFDLTLEIVETSEVVYSVFKYNADLFLSARIERMMGHFEMLLEGIVANPDSSIATLPILTSGEQQQLLVDWNQTAIDYPDELCIHQWFEQQVERTPDAIAVVFEKQQLTYTELNARANQLAHHLQKLGVKPDVLVGICVERCLEMVVGLLGILKAGGAYVPLDPSYPAEWLANILVDAAVPVLVTKESILNSLPECKAEVVCLDRDRDAIATNSLNNPTNLVNSHHLAYVIFTSGSTGKPKGAGVFHSGFVNLIWWYVNEFNLAELRRVLLITSFNFDLTQKNIYAPLVTGGTLHIMPSGIYDPQAILQQIDLQAIAWLNCTPSTFYPLIKIVEDGSFYKLSSLRFVFLGGEPIQVSLLGKWLISPECNATIVNTYGPTECTDVSAFYRLEKPEMFLEKPIPIGYPIANTQLFILDTNHNLLPIGNVGELCIAGAGVGRGYINNTERNATQFILNPFGKGNLYKTGDLARYLPDGSIEFLGRIDHQVKIRGFRIELGEVETILSKHPNVDLVIVTVQEEIPENKCLVAYFVPKSEPAPTVSELHNFLKQLIPQYMMPSTFVILETLPLTPSGKVDRNALPKPDTFRPELLHAFVAPSTPIEETLARIWAEILKVERVGIHDNFFELGGHSLLATQAIAQIQETFNIEIPLRVMFEANTVAELAIAIEKILLEEIEALTEEEAESVLGETASTQ